MLSESWLASPRVCRSRARAAEHGHPGSQAQLANNISDSVFHHTIQFTNTDLFRLEFGSSHSLKSHKRTPTTYQPTRLSIRASDESFYAHAAINSLNFGLHWGQNQLICLMLLLLYQNCFYSCLRLSLI